MTCLNAMLLTSAVLASIAPVTGLGAEAASGGCVSGGGALGEWVGATPQAEVQPPTRNRQVAPSGGAGLSGCGPIWRQLTFEAKRGADGKVRLHSCEHPGLYVGWLPGEDMPSRLGGDNNTYVATSTAAYVA